MSITIPPLGVDWLVVVQCASPPQTPPYDEPGASGEVFSKKHPGQTWQLRTENMRVGHHPMNRYVRPLDYLRPLDWM